MSAVFSELLKGALDRLLVAVLSITRLDAALAIQVKVELNILDGTRRPSGHDIVKSEQFIVVSYVSSISFVSYMSSVLTHVRL